MKLLIINGPNLNLLGMRETAIYGNTSFEDFMRELKLRYIDADLQYFQSNAEGAIIDKIHETGFVFDGIILNAGAYSHTSHAIADAVAAVSCPVVEVHISNTFSREEFRHRDVIAGKCQGLIAGFGLEGYALAVEFLLRREK